MNESISKMGREWSKKEKWKGKIKHNRKMNKNVKKRWNGKMEKGDQRGVESKPLRKRKGKR